MERSGCSREESSYVTLIATFYLSKATARKRSDMHSFVLGSSASTKPSLLFDSAVDFLVKGKVGWSYWVAEAVDCHLSSWGFLAPWLSMRHTCRDSADESCNSYEIYHILV